MQQWKQNFFIIWTGQAISKLSSSILQFAFVWYLTDQTGSALLLTAAMLLGFLPQALLGPFIGVFIDRYNRKMIMAVSDLFIAGVSLCLAISGYFMRVPAWLVLFVMLLRSVGTAFHQPTMQAVTPQLVPGDQLTRCAGYSQALESISQIISPAIAAVLYSSWKLNNIVYLDIAGALLAVGALMFSSIPKQEEHKNPGRIRIWKEAGEGFRILKENRGMLGIVLIGALYTLALMPVSALFPLMSKSYFGGSNGYAGMVEAVFSIGLLLGSLILAKWGGTSNKIYTIIGSFVIMSVSLLISGMLPRNQGSLFAILSGVMGLSGPFYWGMYNTLLQEQFQSEYMGRVLSLSTSIRLITAPLGTAVAGVVGEAWGVEKWFLAASGITLLAAGLCIVVPAVRRCDQQQKE